MNVVRDFLNQTPVAVAETPEDLSGLLRPDCPAIVWDREPLARFQQWIDDLAPGQLPRTRTILRTADVREATAKVCELCGTPDCAERSLLIDDVAALAHIFAGLMHAPYLQLRLDVVTTNACRKFHIDAVTARFVCTYRGMGTQYALATDTAEQGRISTVPTGSPILLRGTLWPEKPNAGLLHRSPPIEGTGETRLLLVLDPVCDPDEHPDRHLIH